MSVPVIKSSDGRFRVRASSAKDLLRRDKSKKEGSWGDSALSVIKTQALVDAYGFARPISSKFLTKGLNLEQAGLDFIAQHFFYEFEPVKNTIRLTDDHFTGECDLLLDTCIRDVKCVWDFASFPITPNEVLAKAISAGYDIQGQVYMHLYDRPEHYIDFVLLPTPLEQCRNEDEIYMLNTLVNAIPMEKRIRTVKLVRDPTIIETLQRRVDSAQSIYQDYLMHM